jgi:L,D-peptidoglycan transpeptidase YkuD (ErfK/YbiS/YcfS/YnhG family)
MRRHRALLGAALLLTAAGLAAAPPAAPPAPGPSSALPHPAARSFGGSQLITAVAPHTGATAGRLLWWDRGRDGRWRAAGSAPARFGAGGLIDGERRVQGTSTTPIGLYPLLHAFGTGPRPEGSRMPYRRITADSWWCQDNASASYNRWVEGLPADCRASEAEYLPAYGTPYERALVIGYNYRAPVRGRGAGIFLHVNGKGATAGCVSVPAETMVRLLAWADRERSPHIAIGAPAPAG